MYSEQIMALINSEKPIAIVKYYEWPIFSKDYTSPRYSLLSIEDDYGGIIEMDIPKDMFSFLTLELTQFEEVLRRNDGIVWERMSFGKKVKCHVPKPKIYQLINQR